MAFMEAKGALEAWVTPSRIQVGVLRDRERITCNIVYKNSYFIKVKI